MNMYSIKVRLCHLKTLSKMKRVYKESELTAARGNSGKNRKPNIVAADANRVRLMTVVPDRNDYINAVFLHVSPILSNNFRKWL